MATGSCACGLLKYSFNSEPLVCALCHCNGCKRSSSSVYTHNLLVPAATFTTSGIAKIYGDKGQSGKNRSFHFCQECGTTLYIVSENIPGVVVVKAGTLDDLSLNEIKYRPTVEIFCKEKYSWLPDIEGARKFNGAMGH
ncbi:CENP-V/GFA domain-containing protein [Fusarium keratoplasticum]|uniref:CENP-V/GFA domain-containing protein n=1 Tax=Fusarium keratoplasticum TaxID=1328300 RepID=A0ACC0RAX9_9HYPO|nr:CENP-V/GFA domain-containing protein [Fusarium keratoplasticum]KAI8680464.1 CENP-V/GFA domain-containing protein [Fusarium keratoplasticum]